MTINLPSALRGILGIKTANAGTIPYPVETNYNRPGPFSNDFNWMQRHRANVTRANTKKPDYLFLGDSITDHWRDVGKDTWLNRIAPKNALNFGIGGDRVQSILWRIRNGEMGKMQPKKVFIMAGSNNIEGEPPQDIAGWTQVLKDEIKKRSPNSKVVIFSVLPRENKNQEQIDIVNQNLRQLDNDQDITYKDLTRIFQKFGRPRKDLLPDGVHPNARAYKIWGDIIRGEIDKNS